jgi:hypothetical protein
MGHAADAIGEYYTQFKRQDVQVAFIREYREKIATKKNRAGLSTSSNCLNLTGFSMVAGSGFEPETFGL